MKEDIQYVKESITVALERLPSLKNLITESFLCKICHSITKPPVTVTKCCNTLLGCSTCCEQWYNEGNGRYCPACRCADGYDQTMQLRGMDDLLVQLREWWDAEA